MDPVVFLKLNDWLDGAINCTEQSCLKENSSILNSMVYDTIYFPAYSDSNFIYFSSILPNVAFQATQYMYNSIEFYILISN